MGNVAITKENERLITIIVDSVFISFLIALLVFVQVSFIIDYTRIYLFLTILSVDTVLFITYVKRGVLTFVATSILLFPLFYSIQSSSVLLFPVLFISAPFFYCKTKGISVSKTIDRLRLRKITFEDISLGIALTIGILFTVFLLSPLLQAIGVNDSQKVYEKLASIPMDLLVVAMILGSIGEEIFFRGFLVEEMNNPVIPAILFSIAHLIYGSLAEFIVVIPIGFILSYFYFYERRLYPTILAHLCFNLFMLIIFTKFL